MDDYSFLFERPLLKTLWAGFVVELESLSRRVDARNDVREASGHRRYRVFEIEKLEISVAI